ncbi:galactokinase [candidate division KSB3 bacterium]|uniref:Galactokinase n=1 Tax=candidate division KSB3 bacterium TaxID=2044937 RepID=A0A9D5Q5D0_9BACT|nr:galactokinase [candidate division KSB3 bacterium]MBD3324102.1 galactokinase [candidate division KSB3 bacterium]
MNVQDTDRIARSYRQQFGHMPELIVSAPGRVNLIGEHTDYNDGFVLPMAMNKRIWIGGSRRDDDLVRLYSVNFDEVQAFSVASLVNQGGWADYVKGVIDELVKAGYAVHGFDAVLAGDVPRGAGLSSSAAIEVATAFFLSHLYAIDLAPDAMALLCQRAENRFVGVNCGIMDQFIARLGKADAALYIDCRDLSYQHIPFRLEGYVAVICNSNVKRRLVGSAYNERRQQCEEGVRLLQTQFEGITALRDVSPDQLAEAAALLPTVVYRRCQHVVTENARVAQAVEALRERDLQRFGGLLNRSHESLRDQYEVSCPELDQLVDIAWNFPGTLGSRMTGAGFGGCTVSLVPEAVLDEFRTTLQEEYAKRAGILADIYVSHAEEGARIETHR